MTHASINRIYRLVFNAGTGMYVAVAETARGRGKSGRSSAALLAAVVALGSSAAFAQSVLPTGGVVASGSAAISQTASAMTIDQSSNAAILNWQSFSIGAANSVRFNQPSVSAVALNRVVGNSASEILGSLSANGKVLLVNQNGILMGSGAQVDTGGFMASTLNIKDSDFLAGKYIFDIANNTGGTAGTVINNGRINTPSGYTVLLAPQVTNNGFIAARAGSVAIGAGNKVTVDMVGDGLISFNVDKAAMNAAVVNTGTIQANGGQVLIKASSANALFDTVLNSTGIIRADSIASVNGRIILDGGSTGVTQVSGEISAKGANAGETGGTIAVLGDKVGLFSGAKLDASGDAGGGTVLVGGNWQGGGTERTASRTIMASGASIDASATNQAGNGSGGTAVVWADGRTDMDGSIKATGAGTGSGGNVETSGKGQLALQGSVNVNGGNAGNTGTGGQWLLDPDNIVISNAASTITPVGTRFIGTSGAVVADAIVNATALGNAITGGNTVTVQTAAGAPDTGNITVSSAVTAAGAGTLNLIANASITVNAAISSKDSSTPMNLGLYADAGDFGLATIAKAGSGSGSGGGVFVSTNAPITTGGGRFSAVTGGGGFNAQGSIDTTSTTGGGDISIRAIGSFSGIDFLDNVNAGSAATGGTIRLQAGGGVGHAGAGGLTARNLAVVSGGYLSMYRSNNITGQVAIQAVGSVEFNNQSAFTSGLVSALTVDGLTYAGASGISSSTNHVSLRTTGANADITLAQGVTAATTAGLVSTGNITGAGVVSGTQVNLSAASGIGALGAAINTQTPLLRLQNTTSGGIYTTNTGDVLVAASNAGGDIDIKTANGSDTIAPGTNGGAGGNITVGTVDGLPGLATTGTGNITLTAGSGGGGFNGNGGNGGNGGAITANAAITAAQSVTLRAGRGGISSDFSGSGFSGNGGSGGAITASAAITAAQSVTLIAGNGGFSDTGVSGGSGGAITANAAITAAQSVTLTAGNGGDGFSGSGGSGGAITANAVITADQSATLTAGSGGSGGGSNGSDGTVTGTDINVTAGTDLTVNGAVNATSGNVSLKAGLNAGNTLTLTDAAGTGAGSITVADATVNTITLEANSLAVTPGGTLRAKLVDLKANAGIGSSTTALATEAAELKLQNLGTGVVNVSNTGNVTVAARNAGGDVSVQVTGNANGLTVGSVGGLDGVTASGDVTLVASSGITIQKAVTASTTAGTVRLQANGDIRNSTAGIITAQNLAAKTNNIRLDFGVNAISGNVALAGTGSSAQFTNDRGFTVDTVAGNTLVSAVTGVTGTGNVRLQSRAGDITLNQNVRAMGATGTVDITAAGKLSMASGTTVSATDQVQLVQSGTAAMTLATVNTGTLSVRSAGFGATLAVDSTKVYDGNTNATNAQVTLTGLDLTNSNLSLAPATAAYDTKDAGTAKTVTATAIGVQGYNTANPTARTDLRQGSNATLRPTTQADITAKALTLTGTVTAANKVYNGNDQAVINTSGATLVGVVGSEVVSLGTAGTFANANAGTGKAVTFSAGSLTGAGAGNYTLSSPLGLMADITPKALTVSGAVAVNRGYDGTTDANVTSAGTFGAGGVVGGDDVRLGFAIGLFDTKDAADGKTVNITGLGLRGTTAANYSLAATTATATANITKAVLSVSGLSAAGKAYDGNTTATVTGGTLSGRVYGGDRVTLGTVAGTFDDKNVGTRNITLSGASLSGADAGNYSLTAPGGLQAVITAKSVSITGLQATSREYNANNIAALTGGTVNTGVAGETLTFTGATGQFASANASATAQAVTVSNAALANGTGAGAGVASNYELTGQPTGLAATISPKALSITAQNVTRTYDGTATGNNAGVTYSAFAGTEGAANLGGSLAYNNASTTNAGSYTLAASGQTSSNYAITYVAGTLQIDRKGVAITGLQASGKTYNGDTVATLTGGTVATGIAGESLGFTATGTFASADAGTRAVTVTGAGLTAGPSTLASNYVLTGQPTVADAVIARASLSAVTGITANKVYDATTNAVVDTSAATFTGRVNTDDVSITGGQASFGSKNASATPQTLNVTSLTLSGAKANNYMLANTTAQVAATITPKALTVTGLTGVDREYNATNTAGVSVSGTAALVGVMPSDVGRVRIFNSAGTFGNKNVEVGKAITVTGVTLSGLEKDNYSVTNPTGLTANITAKALTGSITASDKQFDGSTSATLASRSLAGVILNEVVTYTGGTASFSDAAVGNGKAVNATGLVLSGADKDNYTVSSTAATTANITAVPVVPATGTTALQNAQTVAQLQLTQQQLPLELEQKARRGQLKGALTTVISEPITIPSCAPDAQRRSSVEECR